MGGPMAKVYTAVPGVVVIIAGWGEASNEVPAIMPAEVAAQFRDQSSFRVEDEAPLAEAGEKE
jgi:hypothetical protein